MSTFSRRIALVPACGALLLLVACSGPVEIPTGPTAPAAQTAAPPTGSTSPRSQPGYPTTVQVPRRTSQERARTVVTRGRTRISITDSTSAAVRRDSWVLRGACAVPAGQQGPGSLTWTVGRGIPDTTDFDVVASGELVCGRPAQDAALPELHGKPVQINVDFPTDDITSAYALVVPAT